MKRQLALSLAMTLLVGCAPGATYRPTPLDHDRIMRSPIGIDAVGATLVQTPRYDIYTTYADPDVQARFAALMEGAGQVYAMVAGIDVEQGPPLMCHVFERREDWAAYTQATTGADAEVYLGISRGGYTIGEHFVVYRGTADAALPVMAHEGWHQFSARHFRDPLPPFLEEGLACLFESVRMDDGTPEWRLHHNDVRRRALRHAVNTLTLRPLGELVNMHAGQVVNDPAERIESFYAQAWALAEFLWEAEQGRYRPALRRMFADAAAGTLAVRWAPPQAARAHDAAHGPAQALLEHYLQIDWSAINAGYQAHVLRAIR